MRLIDADALAEGYKRMGYDPTEHPEESYMEGWCKGFNAAVDHCMHHVIHAPTIEERKTGKWIKESQYVDRWDDTIEILRCPICGFKHNYCQGDTGLEDKMWFNYCPNCGAKMEG